MRRLTPIFALLIAAACGLQLPPHTPPSNPKPPAPIEQPAPVEPPASTVAILTVEVQGPPDAIVQVGDREWSTRRDHDGSSVIVEEFRAGDVLEVSARATGYQASIPQRVTMTPGPMPRVVIRLEVPMAPPPDITTPVDQIPPAVWATVRRFVAAYPWPRGDGSEVYIQSLRAWTRRLTEQLRHTHGPEWGHKSTSPSAPASKESIARKIGDDLHVWDMLIGAASGQPVLSGHPSHYHVNDQHFIHVNPVDHLAAAVPPPARAQIPQPWIGLTSFDLGVRLEVGDRRWVDMMVEEGFTVARVVVASVYRTPRTLADGLRQLPLTLSTLASTGLRAEVVVLVDTRDYRMSRDQMRDYMRSVVAICDAQPAAVAGVHVCGAIEVANESTHGTQVDDLSDPSFLRELSSLVPTRYPISWGSSHGGEAPFIGLGSYITHHAARSLSPEQNAAIMAAAQRASGQLVIDDEALGIAEQERAGSRTADPAYGERQARAALAHGLGGVTLHLEAGLTANVDVLGPVQREAIKRFVAAMRLR